jgi:hypothetical protein
MSKIETQLEINGVTYSGKDLDLICLGMSLKEESIIKLLEEQVEKWDLITKGEPKSSSHYWVGLVSTSFIALIKGEK